MRLKPLLLSVLLLPALTGSAMRPAGAEETYRLVSKDAVGDVDQVTDDFQINLSIIATAGGQDQKVDIDNREQQRFKEEVQGITADGHSNREQDSSTHKRAIGLGCAMPERCSKADQGAENRNECDQHRPKCSRERNDRRPRAIRDWDLEWRARCDKERGDRRLSLKRLGRTVQGCVGMWDAKKKRTRWVVTES